ncbi:MAG: quinolinate synthase NadA [Clostridia bacterium]
MTLEKKIARLKENAKAVIVAHTYQPIEVQKIADIVGDSFELSKFCAKSDEKTIVFCGVLFMAESAKILSPEKTVLLPEIDAGCPMADMIDAGALKKMKAEHPDAAVVCYINSSAKVKAESDICCTSSNAVEISKSLPNDKIIFVPDKNLGAYVASLVPEKEFILWKGFCPTHNRLRTETIIRMKELHPGAKTAAHPECTPEVLRHADFIGSTKAIIEYVMKSDEEEYIIATEKGVVDRLGLLAPDKKTYLAQPDMVCRNMKKTTLEKVHTALNEGKYVIELDEEVMNRARTCLQRMVDTVR